MDHGFRTSRVSRIVRIVRLELTSCTPTTPPPPSSHHCCSLNIMNLTLSPIALSAFSSPSKRKASAFEADNDNSENIDPIIFLSPKRSKNPDGSSKDLLKPQHFILT